MGWEMPKKNSSSTLEILFFGNTVWLMYSTITQRIHCPQFSVITLLVEPLQHCTTKCFQFKNLSQTN